MSKGGPNKEPRPTGTQPCYAWWTSVWSLRRWFGYTKKLDSLVELAWFFSQVSRRHLQIPFFRKISQCRIHDGPGRGAETPRRPPQDTSLKTEVDTIHHYAPNHFSIDLYMFFFSPWSGSNPFGMICYLASKRTGFDMIRSEIIAESIAWRCFWHHPAVFGIQEVLMGM